MASSTQSSRPLENLEGNILPPPPGFPAKPISFAQAALKPAAPPAPPKDFPSSSAEVTDIPNKPRLKRYPKDKNPDHLRAYLEVELKDKDHQRLFTQIYENDGEEKRLILMRGCPGSGKSILATLLAGVTDHGVIISADNFFLDRKGIYRFKQSDIGKAHEYSQNKAKEAMMDSKTPVIIDNTNTQKWEMLPYVRMALEHNYTIHVVEPITPWKEKAMLLAQKNSHDVPLRKIKEMLGRYEKGVTPEKLIIMVQKKTAIKKPDDLADALTGLKL